MTSKTALIVVDMQNEFCHPDHGSLLVEGGALDLVEPINQLFDMQRFLFRVATMNARPEHHKSMAHNHKNATPKKTHIELPNTKAGQEHQTKSQRLWPKHCQTGTTGHKLMDGINENKIDMYLTKNTHPDVMQYSGFKDTHGNDKHNMPKGAVSHHLEDELTYREITDVFCVGTAGDYCVSHTAIDAAQAGFKAYVIEDVTKSFDSGSAWSTAKADMKSAGVSVVKMDSPEVQRLKGSGAGSMRKAPG